MITIAGKGPVPPGFSSVAGICSNAPFGAFVGSLKLDVAVTQPTSSIKLNTIALKAICIITSGKKVNYRSTQIAGKPPRAVRKQIMIAPRHPEFLTLCVLCTQRLRIQNIEP
jgi:hypothetical protein